MGSGWLRGWWVGAAATVIIALGACGARTGRANDGSQPPSTGATTESADCQGTSLVISAGQVAAGGGHQGIPLRFRNISSTPCRLTGYPGVAGLTSGAAQNPATRTLSGSLGGLPPGTSGLPVIELAPGEVASALVEGTDVPTGTATACRSFTALLVTPPDARQASRLPASLTDCSGLAVHPVVPGTTGTLS